MANSPLGPPRDPIGDDPGVPDASLSELILEEGSEVPGRELGCDLADKHAASLRVNLVEQGVRTSGRTLVVARRSSATSARRRSVHFSADAKGEQQRMGQPWSKEGRRW